MVAIWAVIGTLVCECHVETRQLELTKDNVMKRPNKELGIKNHVYLYA